ncbi:MAG TPA: choice-of-anchor tandem repeat GloVer-containing protein [Terriglobales bacterium]
MRLQNFPTMTVLMLCLGVAALAQGQESVIHSFGSSTDGPDPAATLVFASDGAAYGTTVTGGMYGYGTVFQLRFSNGEWVESILYSFAGSPDGKNPYGGVVLDKSGNLYGTTVAGGNGGACSGDGCGTVYKLSKSGSQYTEKVLYNFTGGNDGFGPGGGVVFDKSGNLYGTTPDGGKDSEGVVYELKPAGGGRWVQKTIHTFTGGKDGAVGSLGSLLLDGSGNLFGVAELGGAHGAGTLFEISPLESGKWHFNILHAFRGEPGSGFPYGGLVFDKFKNLYGTTYYGGKYGVGSVFQFSPINGYHESFLYSFKAAYDNSPTSTLLLDSSGNLWGTASSGGDTKCQCGAIFEMSLRGGLWTEKAIYLFKGDPDGAYPYYGLAQDSSGALYGLTAAGGTQNQGALFKFVP